MGETRKRGGIWVQAALGVALALVLYVSGYFALSTESVEYEVVTREFDSRYQWRAYHPMAWVECRVRHLQVDLIAPWPRDSDEDPPDDLWADGQGQLFFGARFYPDEIPDE